MIVVGRHDRNAPKTAHRARQGFNAGGAVAVVVRDENVHAGQKSSRRPTERWVYRSAHGRNSGHSGLWNFWIVAHCRSRSWSERAAEVFLCRNLLQAPYAAAARSFLNRTTAGHEENADLNASRVIRKRSVKMILEGLVNKKESKKLLRVPRAKKRNIGVDRPESMPAEPSVCSCVLHGVGIVAALNQEADAAWVSESRSSGLQAGECSHAFVVKNPRLREDHRKGRTFAGR